MLLASYRSEFWTSRFALSILRVVLGAIFVALAAQISIPLKPVPITLQSVAVLAIALRYSKVESATSVLLYLLVGLFYPVFADSVYGVAKFISPTAGYLYGMLAVAYVIPLVRDSKVFERVSNRSFLCDIGLSIFATCVLYIFGVVWLSFFIGLKSAWYSGCVVLIPTGVLKALMLSCVLSLVRSCRAS